MLVKPIINDIETFDANNDVNITFLVLGGNQATGNELIIEDLKTNQAVYKKEQDTLSTVHRVAKDSLTNGKHYKAKIRTRDNSGNWSEFSESVFFYCYSKPILKVLNIDKNNKVNNQTIVFKTEYKQAEDEPMESYKYTLYDNNKKVIKSYPQIFGTSTNVLEQEVAGLMNGEDYFIEVITLSKHGNKGTTGLIPFSPFYIAPKTTMVITPENVASKGGVKISANLVQIILSLYDKDGKLVDEQDVEYLDKEYIDLNDKYGKLVVNDSLNFDASDCLLQLWVKNIRKDETLLRLTSNNGTLVLKEYKGFLLLEKTVEGVGYSRYISNIGVNDSSQYNVGIKQKNGFITHFECRKE